MNNSKISFFTAVLININLMVGAGIYINPGLMAQKAGTLSYLGWSMAALVLLPVVLCIVEVSRLFPGEGSFYSYAKAGLGRTAGFVSGWVYFLGYVAIQSLQMIALRDVLIYQLGFHWAQTNMILFNALFFLGLAGISLISLTTIGKIQNALTIFKILPLILIGVAVFLYSPAESLTATTSSSTIWNAYYTLPLAIFGYWGFEGATSVSHKIEGDSKNASKSILIGFAITVTVFTVFHLGLLRIMGAENLSIWGAPAFGRFLPATNPILARILGSIVPVMIGLAYFNSIYAETTSFSFLIHAMAHERLLFASNLLSKVNKNSQPIMAIFMQVFLSFMFVSVVNHKFILLAISNLGLICAFFLTLMSLFTIHRRNNNVYGMIKTVLGFISCIILGYFSAGEIGGVKYALAFLAIIIAGLIMFKIQDKKVNYEN